MSRLMSDDPIVSSMERTGYPPWSQPVEIECPVCGSTTMDDMFVDMFGNVVGCTDCVRREDPVDYCERTKEEDPYLGLSYGDMTGFDGDY